MSRIDECTVAHKGSAMGIDCLTKAMGYVVHLTSKLQDWFVRYSATLGARAVLTGGVPFSASGCRALKSPTLKRSPPFRLLRDGALGADL